ncbi:MAG: hypothetical protein ACOX9R_08355 [Armatimonadota bacterium]|jgi:hypothetical protein
MTVDELRRRLDDLSEQGYGNLTVVITAEGRHVLHELEGDSGVDLTEEHDPNLLVMAESVDPDDPNAVVVLF